MKFFDLRVRYLHFLVFVFSLIAAASGQNANLSNDLSKSFRKFDLVRITSTNTESLNVDGKSLRLVLDGESVELNVVPNDLRSANYRAENTGPTGVTQLDAMPVNTFKGKVVGRPDSGAQIFIAS